MTLTYLCSNERHERLVRHERHAFNFILPSTDLMPQRICFIQPLSESPHCSLHL